MNVSSFVEIVDSDSYWTEYSDGVNMPGGCEIERAILDLLTSSYLTEYKGYV